MDRWINGIFLFCVLQNKGKEMSRRQPVKGRHDLFVHTFRPTKTTQAVKKPVEPMYILVPHKKITYKNSEKELINFRKLEGQIQEYKTELQKFSARLVSGEQFTPEEIGVMKTLAGGINKLIENIIPRFQDLQQTCQHTMLDIHQRHPVSSRQQSLKRSRLSAQRGT
jgi:hypothetical protein